MHKLYLIRHGQTLYNSTQEEYEKSGQSLDCAEFRWDPSLADAVLSPLGISQCESAIASAHSLQVSKVFVSPLRRALQTCDILFRSHPMNPQIIVYPELHEVLHNSHDVSAYSSFPFPEYAHFDWSLVEPDILAKKFISEEYKHILDGVGFEQATSVLLSTMKEIRPNFLESFKGLEKRSQSTKFIWKNELTNCDIALVSHSTFIKSFTRNNEDRKGIWLENCEIREYVLE